MASNVEGKKMASKFPGTIALNKSKTAWSYRIKITLPNGEKVDTTCRKGADGLPFKTAEEAYRAKIEQEGRLRNECAEATSKIKTATLIMVYEHYKTSAEAKSKAPSTLAKQDSMWRQHIYAKFGHMNVEDITLADLQNYLNELYQEDYAYAYVEGFLKFFYLLFGYAYRLDLIEYDRYVKMFIDKGSRLTMPNMTQADFEESEGPIETFNSYQIDEMTDIFQNEDGNLLTAFYLGLYCGLRISEAFAVRWRNIDWVEGTILINRQMHYEDKVIKLAPVKTLTSVRKVFMPKALQNHLYEVHRKQGQDRATLGELGYKNTEKVLDTMTGEVITGGDFVNRKSTGELLTVNSMKYYSKKIKEELGFEFKFHTLRHTFASNCAANNVNLNMLMDLMGHKKIETTRRYYLNTENPDLIKRTFDILNAIYPEPSERTTITGDPRLVEKKKYRMAHIPRKK